VGGARLQVRKVILLLVLPAPLTRNTKMAQNCAELRIIFHGYPLSF
jgi:hypothetical protein